jgi:hypothetical protein
VSRGEAEFGAEGEQRPVRSKRLIGWSVLLFVAFLAYEITARPAFGVVILCSKFGWDTFLTGYWLWRIDPNRSRGTTCFWFYMAAGLLRVIYAALGLHILLFIAFAAFQPQQVVLAIPKEIIIAGGTYIVAGILSVLATLLGIWTASRSKLRIWVAYPPFMNQKIHKGKNWAEMLAAVVIIFLFMCWMGVFCFIGEIIDPNPPGIDVLIIISLLIISCIPFGVLSFKLFLALKRRFVAEKPSESWEPDLLGEIMVSPMPNWKRRRRLTAIPRSSN